ncbi:MAG: response regulator transcription factor [Acetobacteraceae bacterium]|nr:response regulator transcription factor [Acetobacteraceae bacterium]
MDATAEIIVVDDEAELREAVAAYLARNSLSVRGAGSGAELRQALAERPADAVILDIALPGEDGLSIARALRAQSDIGIVMLTASSEVVDRVVGLEVGADDYVSKPFDLRELLARLRAVLRRRAASRAAAAATAPPPASTGREVRMGRNRLLLDTRRLLGPEGFEIPLSASEFELLRAFAERPGRTLSREMLLQLAHPRGEEHFDRSIDVRITRIRRKIEAVPSRPRVIRTIRGIGYVFDPDAPE